jgi:hypothetical protein
MAGIDQKPDRSDHDFLSRFPSVPSMIFRTSTAASQYCAGNRVVAYFCISAGAVERVAAPGKIRGNAPDTIPVSVIGRLAVDPSKLWSRPSVEVD